MREPIFRELTFGEPTLRGPICITLSLKELTSKEPTFGKPTFREPTFREPT